MAQQQTAELGTGARLRSAVDTTEVIVVRPPGIAVELRCGGRPMVAFGEPPSADRPDPGHSAGTLLGKRYEHESSGLEVLCTKPGDGSLSVGEEPLQIKAAKTLPASD